MREFRSRRGLEAGNEMGHLGHPVDEYENRIMAIRNGQVRDEITRVLSERRGDQERSQLSMMEVTWSLCLLTQKARINIILNKGLDAGEPVISG